MPASEKQTKVFKDPVHGYISIPLEFCNALVDTPIFQRLRHIEQTSMRPLYPAAHHDRFIHSLGVFHLGQSVYNHLKQTALNGRSNIANKEIAEILDNPKLENTFLIACLMHDCGHAPFSHTFESFYNYQEASDTKRVYNRLRECFPGDHFEISSGFEPAPHEAFSAVILKEFYSDKLINAGIKCDIELAAQMITGCTYPTADTPEKQIHNHLIKLLSGNAIDVDKLDYILRDTWASGVNNAAIDVTRLINAMILKQDVDNNIELCYHKSAVSVIQSVVDARNYLYRWIYTHHTVLYYSNLLDLSLRRAARIIFPDNPDEFWQSVFSEKSFRKRVKLGNSTYIYLPADGDILNVLKCLVSKPVRSSRVTKEIEYFKNDVNEYLSHSPQRIPLWKTYAEYRNIFDEKLFGNIQSSMQLKDFAKSLPEKIATKLGATVSPEDIIFVKAEAKRYSIAEGDIQILLGTELKSFTKLFGKQISIGPASMHFFVFIPRAYKDKKDEVIKFLQNLKR